MQALTDQFIASCRTEDGFLMRGDNMTRIEVFVDAAFAFAVTMLVISIDEIPQSVPELMEVSKLIPGFAVSVAQLMWIWSTHSLWSKRFGLEDTTTNVISVALIILVLIYIYPLKIIFMAFFAWITNGYLPSYFNIGAWDELRFLFFYYACGFMAIYLLFVWMYQHALDLREPLRLTPYEVHYTRSYVRLRWAMVAVGFLAALLPFMLPDSLVSFAGFTYMLIGPIYHFSERRRNQQWAALNSAEA